MSMTFEEMAEIYERGKEVGQSIEKALNEETTEVHFVVLCALVSKYFTTHYAVEKEAMEDYNMMLESIADSISVVDDMGMAAWNRGTPQ